ncbi:MAG: DUF2309 domain-containing protein [Planctomycetaceae bacterium]
MSVAVKAVHYDSLPPETSTPHLAEVLAETLSEVAEVIAPVWPLRDYVAVNPYAGLAHRSFLDARAFLKVFSDCETLMPLEHYAAEFQRGGFSIADLEAAIAELSSIGIVQPRSAQQIIEHLLVPAGDGSCSGPSRSVRRSARAIRTIAEHATEPRGIDWQEAIVDEISRHCAAHYDQGQAIWTSPNADLPLFQAWRTVATRDRNIEILGLNGFRRYVAHLPHTAEAAIVYSLNILQVPHRLWSAFLLCQAFSIPGWSAWTKYQAHWTDDAAGKSDDFIDLLAIRLAYDAALSQALSLQWNWDSITNSELASFRSERTLPGDDSVLRYTLLRATEIAYRTELLGSLNIERETPTSQGQRRLAQMVFCIDVRSERIRRHLEQQSSDIETFGFAGFFGMGFEYVELGQTSGCSHLPVLLKPQFKVNESLSDDLSQQESTAVDRRHRCRTWRSLWKGLQTSASSCFSFVETMGPYYGLRLLQRALGYTPPAADVRSDGLTGEQCNRLAPSLHGLNQQGLTLTQQANMAETMLRNLGLSRKFARLVVFCGHSSRTENNPLAAGLDCGACGGHSGEPNARFAALLLNQADIRQALAERGIVIPADTHFVGALHNTTTDAITFFDVHNVPEAAQPALQELQQSCAVAGEQTRRERLPTVAARSTADLFRRAGDWSEVRPEWGLAGNAAMVVAPRSLTMNSVLDARSFLHSYDYRQDNDGKVLETIMTAPMIVANWINLQYYASAVDNHHSGSGTKTIHNVVGKFGILSGNGGDLQTGLPWQSLHTGNRYQHLPLRLHVVIMAPREMIDRIIAEHQSLANLLDGQWLHLIAIDEGRAWRYDATGNWQLMVCGSISDSRNVNELVAG